MITAAKADLGMYLNNGVNTCNANSIIAPVTIPEAGVLTPLWEFTAVLQKRKENLIKKI